MKIGIKYCGGCNPRYDRVAMGNRFVRILDQSVEWVSPDDPEAEMILVIVGCDTACVDLIRFQGRSLMVVKNEESGITLLRRIRGLLLRR